MSTALNLSPRGNPFSQTKLYVNNNSKVLSEFLNRYIEPQLFENIINVCLYRFDIDNNSSPTKLNDSIKIFSEFLNLCHKDLENYPNAFKNIPVNILTNLVNFTKKIVNTKKTRGTRLITYDNFHSHFKSNDLFISKCIENIQKSRILNDKQFKDCFENIHDTIQLVFEIHQLFETVIKIDTLIEQSEKDNCDLLTLTQEYRNLLLQSYTELSNIKVINKVNDLSDYIIISDDESVKKLSNNIVKYLATGYAFYKTGYELIDGSIGGIESSNVHIICGPSNNAKSLFMINLSWQMICNNFDNFKENDYFLFYTLED